ncbi:phosphonate ABC transporter ATP-binding protein [Roseiterribacter gracilis]|uniref:Phosphonates import ATP-binding protein PhnC n=1 Tax=Roseiterribacter gracilis TaxID=2812848 RepID=A0A8S8XG26_9PROT|nr:phosphonates import ATP-binding protein PhnC [Rhodospirillales bacterium TMPK1]
MIVARNIAKTLSGRAVLRAASVTVKAGEVVALVGPSGSGKTTLLRCLARLLEPDAGTIELHGLDVTHLAGRKLYRARRDIGLVYQQFNLVRRLSALDNVLGGRLNEIPTWRVLTRNWPANDVAIAQAALARVGLATHAAQRADRLSGGQQQRVAIARALAQGSRVLLIDEPVSSLDPETAASILRLIRELASERGFAVLVTLHRPEDVVRVADRALRLQDGVLRDRLPLPAGRGLG